MTGYVTGYATAYVTTYATGYVTTYVTTYVTAYVTCTYHSKFLPVRMITAIDVSHHVHWGQGL